MKGNCGLVEKECFFPTRQVRSNVYTTSFTRNHTCEKSLHFYCVVFFFSFPNMMCLKCKWSFCPSAFFSPKLSIIHSSDILKRGILHHQKFQRRRNNKKYEPIHPQNTDKLFIYTGYFYYSFDDVINSSSCWRLLVAIFFILLMICGPNDFDFVSVSRVV